MVMKAGKLQRSKQSANIYFWKVHDRAQSFVLRSHIMVELRGITETFLLVSYSDKTHSLLCFVHGQGQKSEQKHGTKNFVGLHSNRFLLSALTKVSFILN